MKIYISLKETEHLIFNKHLCLPHNRSEVKRAQADFSISIYVDESKLIKEEEQIIVLYSIIKHFEIPEKEVSLFQNIYNIPLGMFEPVKRKVRDSDRNTLELEEFLTLDEKFSALRNALLGVLFFKYEFKAVLDKDFKAFSILKVLQNLKPFQIKIIETCLESTKLPSENVTKLSPKSLKVLWILRLLEKEYNISKEDPIREAFKKLIQLVETSQGIEPIINSFTDYFKNEAVFIIGYITYVLNYELLEKDVLNSLDISNYFTEKEKFSSKEVLLWIIFFHFTFDDSIKYKTFIPLLREEVYLFERSAYIMLQSNFKDWEIPEITLSDKERKLHDIIKENHYLRTGVDNKNLTIVSSENAFEIIDSKFSIVKLSNIALELKNKYSFVKNFFGFFNKFFKLFIKEDKFDKIKYYTSTKKGEEYLKKYKIKSEPIGKLLKDKKVILAFINFPHITEVLEFYKYVLSVSTKNNIEKMVFVYMVERPSSEIQGMEFKEEIDQLTALLTRYFELPIELFVKNKSTNEKEIIRNLRITLMNYDLEKIEVIEENVEMEQAQWILKSRTDYFIKENNKNYYVI